jgi:hypothetical protein
VWKWIAVTSLALLTGFISGQYVPNRNIVVRDDLITVVREQKETTQENTRAVDQLSVRMLQVEKQLAAVDTKLGIRVQ